ncbi:DUF6208 family protein [Aliikangiella sp. IMCC44359]|uniref:DUF6208 family protein n=1 Tax=Aliikangiella sp. IMCC44359 TaxID=3459125 RepID=UPI00403A85A8
MSSYVLIIILELIGKVMLQLIYQLPLTVTSYYFVKYMRKRLKKNAVVRKEEDNTSACHWQGWSEIQQGKSDLLTSMIVCPRWNPHALQHSLGPMTVNSTITFDISAIRNSAKIWVISVYQEGIEVQTISSNDIESQQESYEIKVEPGSYSLFLRYYQFQPDGFCPEITVDGIKKISQSSTANEVKHFQSFLLSIKNKKSWFYYFLHIHVYHMLRWKKYFDPERIRKVYLPYGNPGTGFQYGIVKKGMSIEIIINDDLLRSSSGHIVFFNKYGFPVFWEDITSSVYQQKQLSEDGSYLLRVISPGKKIMERDIMITVD